MKNNNSKKFNLYTQGQRLAARVLLVVWLLGISSPQRALAGRTSPSLWNTSKVMVLGILLASVGAQQNLPSVGAEGEPLVRCWIEEDGTCSAPSRRSRSLQGHHQTKYNKKYLERIFSKLSPKEQDQVERKIPMLEENQGLKYREALSRALEKLGHLPQSENSADLPPPPPAPKTSADLPSPTPAPATPADFSPPPPADNEEQGGDDESGSVTIPAAPVPAPVAPASEGLSADAPTADSGKADLEEVRIAVISGYYAWAALKIAEEELAAALAEEQDPLWDDILSGIRTVKDLAKIAGESANNLWATVSKNPNIANSYSYETLSDERRDAVANVLSELYVGVHINNDWERTSYLLTLASKQLESAQGHLGDSAREVIVNDQMKSASSNLKPVLQDARKLERSQDGREIYDEDGYWVDDESNVVRPG